MSSKIIFLILVMTLGACSMMEAPTRPHAPREFSQGEVILATQLLSKIYDQEMAPLKCVPHAQEASLLLRTIHPRMEVVQDDLEASLDDTKAVTELINSCDQNCTCSFVDDLLREHLVTLSKADRANLDRKKNEKDLNKCLNYVQSTFCDSDIFKELNKEKVDFTFDEDHQT
jgi:hypothetical protein